MDVTVQILVKGKVQGVFYRKSAKNVADQLMLTGWVKNLQNGQVEIYAQGSEDLVNQFIEWCHKGPENAVVTDIQVKETTPFKENKFTIVR